jgi:hypothetical protein
MLVLAKRKRLVAHVSRAAVRGKSKGSFDRPLRNVHQRHSWSTCTLEDRLRVPLQNSRPGTRKSKGTHHRGESITYPRDLSDRQNTWNRAEMEP